MIEFFFCFEFTRDMILLDEIIKIDEMTSTIMEEDMGYIDRIAFNLGQRDEVPNQELAKELAENNDTNGIKEMADHLFDRNKSVASDCLKVMYEASYNRPEIIAEYTEDFVKIFKSKKIEWCGVR